MDTASFGDLMSTVKSISSNLDLRPESWREQLQAIRSTTRSLEIVDTLPDEARKSWQLPLIRVFQRVAFGDADNGAVQDLADWCLRQTLTLLHVYPEDTEILTLIGHNWLLRAQKSLANVYRAERGSSSSSTASAATPWGHERDALTSRAFAEAEQALQMADYVEARGILLPAIEYLSRAVDNAHAQENVTGTLLATAAEAYMSIGNVTSSRMNDRYYRQAMIYLREAAEMTEYSLPTHLAQYLDEYGPLYPPA